MIIIEAFAAPRETGEHWTDRAALVPALEGFSPRIPGDRRGATAPWLFWLVARSADTKGVTR
jgi:hypothetical protein